MGGINERMTFAEILAKCPSAAEILSSYGLHCIGCQFSMMETLEEGCKAHGISDAHIKKMVGDINKLKG